MRESGAAMKLVRIGICVFLTFAVALHGVVEVWSESVFEIGAALLLVAWAVLLFRERSAEIRWSAILWPVAGLLGFGLLQLAFGWTVYPYLTKVELLRWAACLIYVFLTVQVFRGKAELRTLAWFLVSLGFVVALFGIVQYFTFNGKLYWFRELKMGGLPFGPFVNRNHFAGFMGLIAPLSLALLMFRGVRRELTALLGLFAVVQVAGIALSASRGGIISFALSLVVLFALRWLYQAGSTRAVAPLLVLFLAAVLVGWLGIDQVAARFAKIGGNEVSLARREVITRGTWRMFRDHFWAGTGAGTFIAVYPKYEGYYDGKVIEHAHNDYVEVLSDTGIVGGICGLAFLALLFLGSLVRLQTPQSSFSLALHAGALAACCGFLLHSLVDFNLHIPSNAMLFLIQAWVATSAVLAREEVSVFARAGTPKARFRLPGRRESRW
jgi:O-antigen ligase